MLIFDIKVVLKMVGKERFFDVNHKDKTQKVHYHFNFF